MKEIEKVSVSKKDWFYFVGIITYMGDDVTDARTVAVCSLAENAHMIKDALTDYLERKNNITP